MYKDPYHTYLSLAALSLYLPPADICTTSNADAKTSWEFESLDPLLNARAETAKWAREHIPEKDVRREE